MAKNKPRAGESKSSSGPAKKPAGNVTRRKPIQMPEVWEAVVAELARKKPMPVTWFLISLIEKAAVAEGMTNLPPFPWDRRKPPESGGSPP